MITEVKVALNILIKGAIIFNGMGEWNFPNFSSNFYVFPSISLLINFDPTFTILG